MSLNVCVFMGRITRDPEIRQSKSGKSICKFSIAVEDFRKQDEGGNPAASFFDIVCFGSMADVIVRFFKKGSLIAVSCRASQSSWTDKDGNRKSRVEFIADTFSFCGEKREDTPGMQPYNPDSPSPMPKTWVGTGERTNSPPPVERMEPPPEYRQDTLPPVSGFSAMTEDNDVPW